MDGDITMSAKELSRLEVLQREQQVLIVERRPGRASLCVGGFTRVLTARGPLPQRENHLAGVTLGSLAGGHRLPPTRAFDRVQPAEDASQTTFSAGTSGGFAHIRMIVGITFTPATNLGEN